jgi:hypothetical protein
MKRAFVVMLLGIGCTQQPMVVERPEVGPTVNVGSGTPTLPVNHPPITGAGGAGMMGTGGSSGGAGGGAGGATMLAPVSYGARRLTLDQLEASVKAVFGNDAAGNPITWKIGTADGFAARAGTLGAPDYINTVEENLEPSPMYLKFMNDMARSVCNQALVADQGSKMPKLLLRHPAAADVDTNLRHLKLVFHGTKLPATDTVAVAPYRTLFTATVAARTAAGGTAAQATADGWRAVCVALVTAPEFHIY